MFYSQPKSQTQSQTNPNDISPQGLFVIGGTVLAIVVYTKWPKLERYYIEYFEVIYLAAYGLAAMFGTGLAWTIVKHTKKLTTRARLLFL